MKRVLHYECSSSNRKDDAEHRLDATTQEARPPLSSTFIEQVTPPQFLGRSPLRFFSAGNRLVLMSLDLHQPLFVVLGNTVDTLFNICSVLALHPLHDLIECLGIDVVMIIRLEFGVFQEIV